MGKNSGDGAKRLDIYDTFPKILQLLKRRRCKSFQDDNPDKPFGIFLKVLI